MLYYSATRSNFYSLVGLGNSRVKILGLPSSIPGSLCESALQLYYQLSIKIILERIGSYLFHALAKHNAKI